MASRASSEISGIADLFVEFRRKVRRTVDELRSQSRRPPADRQLDQLVAGQRADGSWDLTPVLAGIIGVGIDVLERRTPLLTDIQEPKRVWATMLALTWLERRATANHDEWTLLARKAAAWLASAANADVLAATRLAAEAMINA